MTDTSRQLMKALERLPEDEQDRLAASLLARIDRPEQSSEAEQEKPLYEPFRVALEADLDLPDDYSETYEEDLYGNTADR